MLVCSLIPGARPRETISGLMGRWVNDDAPVRRRVARALVPLIDRLYFWHTDHCRDIARQEAEAFRSLYP